MTRYGPPNVMRLADVIRNLETAGLREEARAVKEANRLAHRLEDLVLAYVVNGEGDRLLARARNLTRKAP